MRPHVSASLFVVSLAASTLLTGCDGCSGDPPGPSAEERERLFVSALASSPPPPPTKKPSGIGHAVNVVPGEGPPRIEFPGLRSGLPMAIMAGEGIGPIRFGATRATVERLMGAPCEDPSETLCRYLGSGLDFKLEGGVVTQIRISRKGRAAKRAADGSILEYGFFNGAILPDLYFGMQPAAMQEQLGQAQKVEPITPMGPDGFTERHIYDGMTLEYDAWSSGKLVLGAIVLTKSETAAAANAKADAERQRLAAEAAKNRPKPRPGPQPKPR